MRTFRGAHLGDHVERHEEVVVVFELLPHELLGLALVRGDQIRACLHPIAQWIALAVEDDADVPSRELADHVAVERRRHLARKRARENHEVRPPREVVQLLLQRLELGHRDLRPPLVDLRVRPGGRICDGSRGPRLAGDPHEVVENRFGSELLDDARPRSAAREPCRDDRDLEDLERAGDVDPLTARERQHLARAMAVADLEDRNGQRAVERGVDGDGDDHVTSPHTLWAVRCAYQAIFPTRPGSETEVAATRFEEATRRFPSYTSTRPMR